jgi:hypothetical protein
MVWAARRERRLAAAVVAGLFLLNPLVQYRHELYSQPHWLLLIAALALFAHRRYGWSALAFGAGVAMYQLLWVIFPFFLLNAFRRQGWKEVMKLGALAALAAGAIDGVFVVRDLHQVLGNTVGQWSLLPHPVADAMNLSYWVSYAIAPAHLCWVQAVLLVGIFACAALRGPCGEAADMVGWMLVALTLFIMLNVLIDGYFYLTVLLLASAYVCIANGWWDRGAVVAD